VKPLTFWFYAVVSILKIFLYNSETQNCQMADPHVPKMTESDLKGQIRKKSKRRKIIWI